MHTLSLAEIFTLRNKAFTKIREHTKAIDAIAAATEAVDAALQMSMDIRSIDEMQGLVTASRLLSAAMDGRAA